MLLRFQVARYEISRWGIEQLGLSFGLVFLLFLMKVARGHAHKSREKPQPSPRPLIAALVQCSLLAQNKNS